MCKGRHWIRELAIVVNLVFGSGNAFGQGLQVDQSWIGVPNGGPNAALGVVQEFTPSLSALNGVEFVLFNTLNAPFVGSAEFSVNVRAQFLDGPVIGTSEKFAIPAYRSLTGKFEFANLVPLIPNNRYFLEIVQLSGPQVLAAQSADCLVFREGIILDRALWLQESIMIPEPSTALLALTGALMSAVLFLPMRQRAAARA